MVNELTNDEPIGARTEPPAAAGDTLLVFGDGGRYAHEFRQELTHRLDPTGRLDVRDVDVWSTGSVAAAHGVRSLPTAVLLRDGREHARLVGPASRRRIAHFATALGSPSDPRAVPSTPSTRVPGLVAGH